MQWLDLHFPDVAGYIRYETFVLLCHFTMCFGDRFCVSRNRKGRTRGGGFVHPKVTNSMAVSGLSFGNTLVGTGWAISVLLCTKGIRNQSSHLVGPPFTGLNKWLPAKSHDYCKLVKGWVWFELQTCRRWL